MVEQATKKIDFWLGGSVLLSLIILFILTGLTIRQVFLTPVQPRSFLERELINFQNEIKNNPNNVNNRIGLARVLAQMGNKEEALNELGKAVKINPKVGEVYFEEGLIYLSQKKTDIAIKKFKIATKVSPKFELAHYELGIIYLNEKNYKKAIEALKKTIELKPSLADAHYYLGKAYEKNNQQGLAKQEYSEALRYVPDYKEAKDALEKISL